MAKFPQKKNVAEVFIIESLGADDMNNNRCDGKILESQLKLIGANPIYRYALNLSDMRKALLEFDKSEYRFLHVSCHGDADKVLLAANPRGETYVDFSRCFEGVAALSRITFSACRLGNYKLFETFYEINRGVHSLAAPIKDLPFKFASLYWAVFYTKLMDECRSSNNHVHRTFIEGVFPRLSKALGVPMRYAIYEPNNNRVKVRMTEKGRPKYIYPWK